MEPDKREALFLMRPFSPEKWRIGPQMLMPPSNVDVFREGESVVSTVGVPAHKNKNENRRPE